MVVRARLLQETELSMATAEHVSSVQHQPQAATPRSSISRRRGPPQTSSSAAQSEQPVRQSNAPLITLSKRSRWVCCPSPY